MSGEQLFTPEKLAAMNALIEPHRPLTPEAQRAVLCAGCIMSRFVGTPEEPESVTGPPGFLKPEIEQCTGLPDSRVTSTLKILHRAGLITSQQVPSDSVLGQLYSSGNPPSLLMPTTKGQSFFTPARRQGCVRKIQHAIVGSMRERRRELFVAAAEASGNFTIDDLVAGDDLENAAVSLTLLVGKGVLEVVGGEGKDSQYRLTELGQWLTVGLSRAHWIDPPAETTRRQYAPQRTPEALLSDWVVEKIRSTYTTYTPNQQDRIIDTVRQLIADGVLAVTNVTPGAKFASPTHNLSTGEQLGFSPIAVLRINPAQRAAITALFGLAPLLYGYPLSTSKLVTALQLKNEASFKNHAKKIYEDLVETLRRGS